MVTWVLFALNVAVVDTQTIAVPTQPLMREESREFDGWENIDWGFDLDDPDTMFYLAMQMRAAGGSQLGQTGGFQRDSRPTFGRRSGYAHKYRRQRVYRRPPPLITSKQVARRTVSRNVARTTWGGRRGW